MVKMYKFVSETEEQGSGSSLLTAEQQARLKDATPFTEKEVERILKRFSMYLDSDKDKDKDTIHQDTILAFPEFIGHPLVPGVLTLFVDKSTHKIDAEKFLYFLSVFSSRTNVNMKRKALFKSLDIYKDDCLEYEEVYRLYKVMFDRALSDDQILKLTLQCMEQLQPLDTHLLSKDDFNKVVPDRGIISRMTIDLQLLQ